MPDEEDALEPLQQWPEKVSHELWRSQRQLFGDPDLGMPAAQDGDPQYRQGIGAMRAGDAAAAGEAFDKASALGHPGAWREIGIAVFNELPAPLKIASVPLFERGAEGGDARSMCYLGLFCRINDNQSGAIAHFRAADGAGDPEGSRELGILLEKTGDNEGARAALQRSRDRGSASGTLALGFFSLNKMSDVDGAESAFRKAAEMGHPKGAFNLAHLLEDRGDADQAERFRARTLENALQHRALLESMEGPGYIEKLEQVHAGRTTATTAASGSSCMLLAMAMLGFVFGVAALR
ncbi:MAG TPA: hypothetical protein VNO20_04770 [Solirubrobacterales bacterium]|nr:hypothetical protein [Solirubrobacterales bacterium]